MSPGASVVWDHALEQVPIKMKMIRILCRNCFIRVGIGLLNKRLVEITEFVSMQMCSYVSYKYRFGICPIDTDR